MANLQGSKAAAVAATGETFSTAASAIQNVAASAASSLLGLNAGVALGAVADSRLDLAAASKLMADPAFRGSLMMHSINGYM